MFTAPVIKVPQWEVTFDGVFINEHGGSPAALTLDYNFVSASNERSVVENRHVELSPIPAVDAGTSRCFRQEPQNGGL